MKVGGHARAHDSARDGIRRPRRRWGDPAEFDAGLRGRAARSEVAQTTSHRNTEPQKSPKSDRACSTGEQYFDVACSEYRAVQTLRRVRRVQPAWSAVRRTTAPQTGAVGAAASAAAVPPLIPVAPRGSISQQIGVRLRPRRAGPRPGHGPLRGALEADRAHRRVPGS